MSLVSLKFAITAAFIGNCGYIVEGDKLDPKYLTCNSEPDKMCGLLQCQYDHFNPSNLNEVKPSINNPRRLAYVSMIDETQICAIAAFDIGKYITDVLMCSIEVVETIPVRH